MSSNSGGQTPSGTKETMTARATPIQSSESNAALFVTPTTERNSKKRKRENLLSPFSDDSDACKKTLLDQKKLAQLTRDIIKEVKKLVNELGEKTKRETRISAETLNLLTGTIEEGNLLDSLGHAFRSIEDDPGKEEEMAMDVMSVNEELMEDDNLCSRCKNKIDEEKDLKIEARKLVQDLHIQDTGNLSESSKVTLKKVWPEDCFQKSEIVIGNPLQSGIEGDILLVVRDTNDDSNIVKSFMDKYAELKSIITEDLPNSNLEYLENSTRTKNSAQNKRRLYIAAGGSMDKLFLALRELEQETRTSKTDSISVVVADENARKLTRKLTEVVFLQTDIKVKMFTPKRESNKTTRDSKYESIVVTSTNKSYSEMLRAFRENIDPEEMGINIKTTRKTKDESLLIIAEKGKKDLLQKKLDENINLKEIHIVEKKCELILSGMDSITTRDEIQTAIIGKLGEEGKNVEFKSIHTNRNSEQVATLEMTVNVAKKLIDNSPIRIGWTMCRLKEKITIPRCTNCLKMGHQTRNCRSKKKEVTQCLKCTKEGHVTKDCPNQSHCISCDAEGHRSDSMSCPKYRKMVNQRGSNIT